MKFTGIEIDRIVRDVGMTPNGFAHLLGVHVTTVYRWMMSGEDFVPQPPEWTVRLLAILRECSAARRREVGRLATERGWRHAWTKLLMER
jgi:DNA-binding transcriptional regulator YiaG